MRISLPAFSFAAFVLLADTGLGYAIVAAIIVAAILYFIFEAIV